MADTVEDLTLVQLRGMRREVVALLENQATFAKQIGRLYEVISRLDDSMRNVQKDILGLKSDVALLEIQNIARHGETLNLLRKIGDEDE